MVVSVACASSYAHVDGVRLEYEVVGSADAPPMVLLHALGERGADWAQVAATFAERLTGSGCQESHWQAPQWAAQSLTWWQWNGPLWSSA